MNNYSYFMIGGHMKSIDEHDVREHDKEIANLKGKLMDFETIDKVSNLYKVFSDKTRLRILNALSVSDLCVNDISDVLGMSQSSISHQLKFLRDMNLVKDEKKGKSVYYSLMDEHIQKIIEIGVVHINEK